MPIHSTAIVDPSARIAESAEIGPYSVIGTDVEIGARTKLMAHVFMDGPMSVGEDNVFFPYSTIGVAPQDLKYHGERSQTRIGNRNKIRELERQLLDAETGKTIDGDAAATPAVRKALASKLTASKSWIVLLYSALFNRRAVTRPAFGAAFASICSKESSRYLVNSRTSIGFGRGIGWGGISAAFTRRQIVSQVSRLSTRVVSFKSASRFKPATLALALWQAMQFFCTNG